MEYLEHQRSIAPFWGGEDYLAPGEASAHVSNKGRNFFKKHLSSADHMLIGDLGCWCGRHVGILFLPFSFSTCAIIPCITTPRTDPICTRPESVFSSRIINSF